VSPNDLLETPLPPNRSQSAAAVVGQALASLPTSVLPKLPRRKNGHSAVCSTSASNGGADVNLRLCLYLHLDGSGASSKARWAVRKSALHLVPEAAGARSGWALRGSQQSTCRGQASVSRPPCGHRRTRHNLVVQPPSATEHMTGHPRLPPRKA